MELYAMIKKRVSFLEKRIPRLERMIEKAGEGDICIHTRDSKRFWGIVKRINGKRAETYISISDKRFRTYINKYCAKKYYRIYKEELSLLKRLLVLNVEDRISEAQASVERLAGDHADDEFVSPAVRARRWGQQPYDRLDMDIPVSSQIETKRGDIVRSKLECIAVDTVYSMGLDYRLDAALELVKSGVVKYPDITIMSPYTGKIIYIELFGMMSDPDYAVQNFNKINLYARNGILVGKNFLPVFDYPGAPFDRTAFMAELNYLLQN